MNPTMEECEEIKDLEDSLFTTDYGSTQALDIIETLMDKFGMEVTDRVLSSWLYHLDGR